MNISINCCVFRTLLHSDLYRLTLDEIAAAAELILAQEEMGNSPNESSDEGADSDYDDDVESEGAESEDGDLGDSGYGGGTSPMDTRCACVRCEGVCVCMCEV